MPEGGGAPGSSGTEGVRGERVAAMRTRVFRSLPARIIVSVFAAALVTSLAVTWISIHSIESFLRREMADEFAEVLRSSREHLELWYAQIELDVARFAAGPEVTRYADALSRGGEPETRRAREALRAHWTGVLERNPRYAALFATGPPGERWLWLGEHFDRPGPWPEDGREGPGPRVGSARRVGGRLVQVASAPIHDARGVRVGALHAAIDLDAAGSLWVEEGVLPERVAVVGPDGTRLLGGARSPARYEGPRPGSGPPSGVGEREGPDGGRVVGSAVRFPRFDWTLVVEEPYEVAFAPVGAVIRRTLGLNLVIVLAFGAIAFQMARSIVRPIVALSDAARHIAAGGRDVALPEPRRDDEIGLLTRAFRDMTERLRENRSELVQSRAELERANGSLRERNEQLERVNEVLEQLSITDGLTKLHNHRFFQDHLRREMRRSARTGEPLALLLVDVDDFKGLNDRYGHAVGDAVLRRTGEVLNGVVRETDLLARYGGEEFALLAPQTPLEGAVALGEKVREAVAAARFSIVDLEGPREIAITVSVGVSSFRGDEKAFFNEADRALYRAKHAGKDCVVSEV